MWEPKAATAPTVMEYTSTKAPTVSVLMKADIRVTLTCNSLTCGFGTHPNISSKFCWLCLWTTSATYRNQTSACYQVHRKPKGTLQKWVVGLRPYTTSSFPLLWHKFPQSCLNILCKCPNPWTSVWVTHILGCGSMILYMRTHPAIFLCRVK